jgi:arylsulfatase
LKRQLTLAFAAILCTTSPTFAQDSTSETRPNVLLILADDVGYSDLGCYGGEVATPNLDALAADGLRFTQFYNTARCCPTRASLLTGLYPHQAGMGHMTETDHGVDGYRGDLNKQCVTIAEVLKDSGYRTYAIGKWHISSSARPNGPQYNWPLQRGFQKYYGTIWGAASYFDPGICRGNTWYSRDNDPEYKSDDYYFTDALGDNAVQFLEQHQTESPGKPFFLYTAFTAAHWPLMAREKDIAKYKGRFDAGYDTLRHERLKRMQKFGIIDPKWDLSPTVGDLSTVKNREWELRCMEVYAAMLDRLDQNVGKLITELKKSGQYDNTLILFLQDNGACAEDIGREATPTQSSKPAHPLQPDEITAGGHPQQTRDGKPMRSGVGVMPGGPDTYISYGKSWANVSDTPFREYKHWVHEGGIATPLIAHWPKGIPKKMNNSLVAEPSHLIDIMATCVDLAHANYPTERDGNKIVPLQGVSLKPLLTGGNFKRPQPIFWEHEGNRAVREGKWKLVAKENQPWELYNMENDRTEMHDLAAAQPDRVKQMAAQWDDYAAKSNVLPLGAWKSGPARRAKQAITMKQGDVVESQNAPMVDDRALTITVELSHPSGEGVLVSQGGIAHGYALLVRNGSLELHIRHDGDLRKLVAANAMPDAPTTVTATLDAAGNARLIVNGNEIAKQDNLGVISKNPKDALSAGHEVNDPVGDYSAPFTYAGQINSVSVQAAPAAGSAGH